MVSKRDASLRHSLHYAGLLLQADHLYQRGDSNIADGLSLFDHNWKNIEIGQNWAAKRADSDEEAASLASEYPERGAYCLYLRQKPLERITWLDAALQVAHHRGFELVEGTLHGKLGLAYTETGNYQQALEHYSVRLELAEKLNDYEGLGEGLCNLGILFDEINDLQRAKECFEKAQRLAGYLPNSKITEIATGNLGLVYLKQNEYENAYQCFQRHLLLARTRGDQWGESNALTNIGIALLKLEETELALTYFEQSIAINRALGDLDAQGRNLSYLGQAMIALGQLDRAISTYQDRITIAQNLGDERGEAIGSWNLGELLIKRGNHKDGLVLLRRCVDYEYQAGDSSWPADQKIVKQIEARFRR